MRKIISNTIFVLLSLTACCNSSHPKIDDTKEPQMEPPKDTITGMMALINQSFNISEMESKLAEMRSASEEMASEAWELYDEPEYIGDWEPVGDFGSGVIGDWLYGNWEYSGYDEWVGRYTMYVCINENNLRWGYNGKESYNGPYEINMEDHKIYVNRHNGFSTYINFDPRNQRLSDGDGHYFTKVNRSVGANYSNSNSNNSNAESYSMKRFNQLNEEGQNLVEEIGRYYYSGQASPYTIQAVYRLKQIQDEKISLAQQMGDKELEAICLQQKNQTLIALRQMGF